MFLTQFFKKKPNLNNPSILKDIGEEALRQLASSSLGEISPNMVLESGYIPKKNEINNIPLNGFLGYVLKHNEFSDKKNETDISISHEALNQNFIQAHYEKALFLNHSLLRFRTVLNFEDSSFSALALEQLITLDFMLEHHETILGHLPHLKTVGQCGEKSFRLARHLLALLEERKINAQVNIVYLENRDHEFVILTPGDTAELKEGKLCDLPPETLIIDGWMNCIFTANKIALFWQDAFPQERDLLGLNFKIHFTLDKSVSMLIKNTREKLFIESGISYPTTNLKI